MISFLKSLALFLLLTLFTQVSGILYILHQPLSRTIKRRLGWAWPGAQPVPAPFLIVLAVAALVIVPLLARPLGRVPLPVVASSAVGLGPARWFKVLANRHYVTPQLYAAAVDIAARTSHAAPGTELRYLDANFPFLTGFPLLPHRSHDDGKKLDLSFLYLDAAGYRAAHSPGFLGYGHVEGLHPGEADHTAECAAQGYLQYDLLRRLSWESNDLTFDEGANRWILETITADRRIGKVFVEPHLKRRLGQSGNTKIRYHGCAAVRHDVHVHVQLLW